jgi:hypothetical protein
LGCLFDVFSSVIFLLVHGTARTFKHQWRTVVLSTGIFFIYRLIHVACSLKTFWFPKILLIWKLVADYHPRLQVQISILYIKSWNRIFNTWYTRYFSDDHKKKNANIRHPFKLQILFDRAADKIIMPLRGDRHR